MLLQCNIGDVVDILIDKTTIPKGDSTVRFGNRTLTLQQFNATININNLIKTSPRKGLYPYFVVDILIDKTTIPKGDN